MGILMVKEMSNGGEPYKIWKCIVSIFEGPFIMPETRKTTHPNCYVQAQLPAWQSSEETLHLLLVIIFLSHPVSRSWLPPIWDNWIYLWVKSMHYGHNFALVVHFRKKIRRVKKIKQVEIRSKSYNVAEYYFVLIGAWEWLSMNDYSKMNRNS